jgi:hypothetical protein
VLENVRLIRDLATGRTVILVEHTMKVVMHVSDRIVWVRSWPRARRPRSAPTNECSRRTWEQPGDGGATGARRARGGGGRVARR